MSIRLVCDGGCGETTDDHSSFEKRGYAEQRHYCKKCVVEVDKYLKERDSLHTKLAKEWSDGMKKLQKEHNGGLLPD